MRTASIFFAATVGSLYFLPLGSIDPARGEGHTRHGHARALSFLTERRLHEIEAIDTSTELSVEERSFVVKRVFAPGAIDSRGWLWVVYEIAGNPKCAWHVDLNYRTIQPRDGCTAAAVAQFDWRKQLRR